MADSSSKRLAYLGGGNRTVLYCTPVIGSENRTWTASPTPPATMLLLLPWALVAGHMPDVPAPEQLPPSECAHGCADWAVAVTGDGELAAMFHDAATAAAGGYGRSCMQLGNSIPNTDCVGCPGYHGAWCKCAPPPPPSPASPPPLPLSPGGSGGGGWSELHGGACASTWSSQFEAQPPPGYAYDHGNCTQNPPKGGGAGGGGRCDGFAFGVDKVRSI